MTIPFPAFMFGAGGLERVDAFKNWNDTFTPSKTRTYKDISYYTRNKTGNLGDSWASVSKQSRYHGESLNDTLAPVKTTDYSDTYYPDNFVGSLDPDSCPGPTVTVDLTWSLGPYTSYSMTLERRDGVSWTTLTTSLAAGTESYSDTGANDSTTNLYRIKLNISGSTWIETSPLTLICPE
jgi:hypothetical protein